MVEILRGRITPSGRRPSAVPGKVRICAHSDCSTKLSMYNRGKTCHVHATTRYPRVRGSVLPA